MVRLSQEKGLLFSTVVIICSVVFLSCASTKPIPRKNKKPITSQAISKTDFVFPDGWIDITASSKISSISLWLVRQDFSASIIFKEIQTDASTRKIFFNEDICVAANISLRLKMADESPRKRITKVPELSTEIKGSCMYVYEVQGILRRVIVFRKQNKIYESEMMRENSSKSFEELTIDQINIIRQFQTN